MWIMIWKGTCYELVGAVCCMCVCVCVVCVCVCVCVCCMCVCCVIDNSFQ